MTLIGERQIETRANDKRDEAKAPEDAASSASLFQCAR